MYYFGWSTTITGKLAPILQCQHRSSPVSGATRRSTGADLLSENWLYWISAEAGNKLPVHSTFEFDGLRMRSPQVVTRQGCDITSVAKRSMISWLQWRRSQPCHIKIGTYPRITSPGQLAASFFSLNLNPEVGCSVLPCCCSHNESSAVSTVPPLYPTSCFPLVNQ